jgi:hypothetical protein
VGSGKSTALRKLLELLNPNKYRVIYISDSALTPRHFYWESLRQLGCEPKFNRGQDKRQLHQVILDSYNPLSLILVGQPELKRVLQLQVYEAIAQRVNLRYHLPPLDRQESKEYVCHHLKVAGITSSIFTDDALDVIYEYSGGIARKINNVCLACLLSASASQKRLIDDHMVRIVIENEFAV